ncbi:hypothetical protein FKM82_020095 [Ascaphus truei]
MCTHAAGSRIMLRLQHLHMLYANIRLVRLFQANIFEMAKQSDLPSVCVHSSDLETISIRLITKKPNTMGLLGNPNLKLILKLNWPNVQILNRADSPRSDVGYYTGSGFTAG